MLNKLPGRTEFGSGPLVWSAIVLIISVALLTISLVQSERSAAQREAFNYLTRSNQWASSQLSFELVRFLSSVDRYVLGDQETHHEDVTLRFDVLWSRIPAFLTGPEAAAARELPGAEDTVRDFLSVMEQVEPVVLALAEGDAEARAYLHDTLGRFQTPLMQITQAFVAGPQRIEFMTQLDNLSQRGLWIDRAFLMAAFVLILISLTLVLVSRRQMDRERAARFAADQASRAKTRFLATMGHELRTPLNAIIGFADLIANDRSRPDDQSHTIYAGEIQASGQRLLKIVTNTLDMAKIERGDRDLSEDVFDPERQIRAVIRQYCQEDGVRADLITLVRPEFSVALTGDPRYFARCVRAVIENSVQFGASAVTVTLSWAEKGLDIVIADDGPGIDAETLARIGEPFGQSDQGLNRRHEGAGLGLAIAHGIMSWHEGWLEIESGVGIGTTVILTMPDHRIQVCDGSRPAMALSEAAQ